MIESPSEKPIRWSVLIPTYNYGHFLQNAIESVLAQTVKAFEIIVADDGSTDDTPQVVASYGDRVHYRQFKHMGVYALRQASLAEIRGDWFLNLDADNWIEPDFLEQMSAAIKTSEPDASFAFAYPDMQLFGDSHGRVKRPEFDAQKLKNGNYVDMNSAIRTKVARRFGFDPAFNAGQGDYDFFLTLAENRYRGVRVPKAILHYRVHAKSISQMISRKRAQRKIMRQIIRKHRNYFSPAEARAALAAADNKLLVALIGSRSPFAGVFQRMTDWLRFVQVGLRHAELREQTSYFFRPRRYFARRDGPSDIFYFFRDTPSRRKLVGLAHENPSSTGISEQLFGYDSLRDGGLKVNCNMRWPRIHDVKQGMLDCVDRRYTRKKRIGLGDLGSLWAHLKVINRARVIFSTSDNVGLAAARLKECGLLLSPLVYVSIGLPERIVNEQRISPARAERYRRRLRGVERVVAYGYAEADWLRVWLEDPDKVTFIPFGVNTEAWRPVPDHPETIDVLGVGNDIQRDFGLLIDYARRRPNLSFCIVTCPEWAASLGELPPNVKIEVALPVEELRTWMASAKVLALPVKENTYSGATTTLLQGMAMAKACAVSRVGAIHKGYGFEDGVNLAWLEPGSQSNFDITIDNLLDNRDLRRQIGQSARKHVEESLTWSKYVASIRFTMSDWISENPK